MKKTILIIPFYNDQNYLRECIETIWDNYDNKVETIIVDNSTKYQDLSSLEKKYNFLTIIKTSPRIGFAKACNTGAEEAIKRGADYLIIINQDTKILAGSIEALMYSLDSDPKTIISSPINLTYESDSIEDFFIRWHLVQNPRIVYDALHNKLKDQYKIKYTSGTCFIIRSVFVKNYGLFDPLYFMYHEDEDLCRRVNMLGGNISITPNAEVANAHSHTTKNHSDYEVIYRMKRRSGFIYHFKNSKIRLISLILSYTKSTFRLYIIKLLSIRLFELMRLILIDINCLFILHDVLNSRRRERSYSIKED